MKLTLEIQFEVYTDENASLELKTQNLSPFDAIPIIQEFMNDNFSSMDNTDGVWWDIKRISFEDASLKLSDL